mgnify:CR=1 FL=1
MLHVHHGFDVDDADAARATLSNAQKLNEQAHTIYKDTHSTL